MREFQLFALLGNGGFLLFGIGQGCPFPHNLLQLLTELGNPLFAMADSPLQTLAFGRKSGGFAGQRVEFVFAGLQGFPGFRNFCLCGLMQFSLRGVLFGKLCFFSTKALKSGTCVCHQFPLAGNILRNLLQAGCQLRGLIAGTFFFCIQVFTLNRQTVQTSGSTRLRIAQLRNTFGGLCLRGAGGSGKLSQLRNPRICLG